MFKTYLKIAWRNLIKNKFSSFINIGGLAVGMAVAVLIGLWIYDELSFNKYHDNYSSIGRVMKHNGTDLNGTYSSVPIPLASELRNSFSGDFKHVVLSTGNGNRIISVGANNFSESGRFMQAGAAEMLSLKMLSGSGDALKDPNSILIRESLAKKLFGDVRAINKVIKLDNEKDLKIAGVFEDIPDNSSFAEMSFIGSWDMFLNSTKWVKEAENNWQDNSFAVYVQLSPNSDFAKSSARIKDIELKFIPKERHALKPELFVHPMSKWHLYSYFENRFIATSEQLKMVWFYAMIGLFVLILACINFMNLATARSEKRAKEVGIRKAVGSARIQLIWQFFCESILTVAIAFLISLILVQLTLPWFNGVADKSIFIPFVSGFFWLSAMIFILLTGLLAGSYPAFYLSSFNPVKVLKGVFKIGKFAAAPRKVLVIFQFTVSITLIIGTVIVFRQIKFAMDRPVGYSQEGLIQIKMATPEFEQKYDLLKNELKNTGFVSEVSKSSSPVTASQSNTGGLNWKGKDLDFMDDFAVVRISEDYAETVGLEFIDGRSFSKDYASDSSGLIINEAAVKYMGLKNPVGQTIEWGDEFPEGTRKFTVLGVIKNMVMNSPFEPVKQTVFVLSSDVSWISIKVHPNVAMANALPKIESIFKREIPAVPFSYRFVTDDYANKFAAEQRVGKLATFFAVLAIIISCLGLFGLASFVAEQRTKEIGIRKVLGASVANLWQMLSKDFVGLVLVSCLIAIPLASYLMSQWLEKYEYRSEISWWIFGLGGTGALLLTLLTVSFQAIKAALANPVKSLRSE